MKMSWTNIFFLIGMYYSDGISFQYKNSPIVEVTADDNQSEYLYPKTEPKQIYLDCPKGLIVSKSEIHQFPQTAKGVRLFINGKKSKLTGTDFSYIFRFDTMHQQMTEVEIVPLLHDRMIYDDWLSVFVERISENLVRFKALTFAPNIENESKEIYFEFKGNAIIHRQLEFYLHLSPNTNNREIELNAQKNDDGFRIDVYNIEFAISQPYYYCIADFKCGDVKSGEGFGHAFWLRQKKVKITLWKNTIVFWIVNDYPSDNAEKSFLARSEFFEKNILPRYSQRPNFQSKKTTSD